MHQSQSLRVLHLSDIHVTGDADYQQYIVFRGLLNAINTAKWPLHPIHLVIVTGDLVNGEPNESLKDKDKKYGVAGKFLDRLLDVCDLPRQRLFVIPGNHDVHRESAQWLVSTLSDEQHAFHYFSADKLPHAAKFTPFVTWFNDFFAGIRTWDPNTTCQPPETLTVDKHKVTILALNSALFCSGDRDHRQLWLGRPALDNALSSLIPRNNLTLALMHHPLDWLHDDERTIISRKLGKYAHVVLRGHLHESDAISTCDGTSSILYSSAGACYQTLKWPNCANIIEFGPVPSIRIIPLRYQDRPHELWTIDHSVYPDSSDGSKIFDFPIAVPVPTRMASVTGDSESLDSSRELWVPRFTLQRYVDPEKFVGRAKELHAVLDLIEANESVLVIGTSRSGKTSFWYKLRDELEKRSDQRLKVQINLQFSGDKTVSHFLSRTLLALSGGIARGLFGAAYSHLEIDKDDLPPKLRNDLAFMDLYELVQVVKSRTHRYDGKRVRSLRASDFDGFVIDLLEIAASRGQTKCLLFFDEANYLPEKFSIDLLTNINECLSGQKVACLYAVDPRQPESFERLQKTFHHHVVLEAFNSFQDMLELISIYYREVAGPDAQLPLSREALDLIWKYSLHLPYQIQWLSWLSFSRAHARNAISVEVDDVNSAFATLKARQPHLFDR